MDRYINKIIEMGKEDQKLRKEFMDALKSNNKSTEKLSKKMRELDAKNTKKLKNILNEIGFPAISKVGRKCALYSWLIVQHSPDTGFMRDYLAQMEEHIFEDVEKEWCQRLVDILLVLDGEKQLYGTQSKLSKS